MKDVEHLNDLKRQSGFTLIEALVVMIVGVVILAAAAAGIGKLFSTSDISTEANNITQMQANTKSVKNGGQGYKGLNNTIAQQYNIVPVNMAQDTTAHTISNAWNGAVVFGTASGDQAYTIVYNQVPTEACTQLAQKLSTAGWGSIDVGGKKITSASSLADIGTACSASNSNTMTFTSAS
ncbi:Major structural subunit of bundle-forming pilus [Pandoraea anapnoica]|uniref:Major structural subunit of bundle-forming pilus n=1 Tax=Pandoraea anapnoica TaxID=2508301 RepID=A0A5E5AQA3_9BURK|nr:type 4 pilus major pilin [Pandoraea anapnoica]VVE75197.1 Major structural subunit of bundle-forming pilus [Pandoraea anapnoica]